MAFENCADDKGGVQGWDCVCVLDSGLLGRVTLRSLSGTQRVHLGALAENKIGG